jgi:uncharacterized protein
MSVADPLAAGDEIALAPVELLVFQGTPFCNIDCRYCYLGDRDNHARISVATVQEACRQLACEGLAAKQIDVLWHAGEPLVLPPDFYHRAFAAIEKEFGGAAVTHKLQTNATLIDHRWIELFRRWNVQVGVSIDGPPHINDCYRTTRAGRPTSGQVLAGIDKLREAGLDLSAICVLTRDSLNKPAELFAFFQDLGVDSLAFNIDEAAGPHRQSSHCGGDPADFRHFLTTYFSLVAETNSRQRVRELARGLMNVFKSTPESSYETVPIRVLTVGHDGGFSTFSPDLHGATHQKLGPFQLGNVHDPDAFRHLRNNHRLLAMLQSVRRGIDACASSCGYFQVCRGGLPANKFGEHGTLEATETTACQFKQQAVTDAVVALLLQGRLQPQLARDEADR